MEVVKWIAQYLNEATEFEKDLIRGILSKSAPPKESPVDNDYILSHLFRRSQEIYTGNNALMVIKDIKERTGWGLKECKEWFDFHIKNK